MVKIGVEGVNDDLPMLRAGERVLLYDEEFEIEATVLYDRETRYWMARPDFATWRAVAMRP